MNFLGHAAVACWVDPDPRWVLGAMLPDFATMSRTRVSGAECPKVMAGIAYHHATDAAFHAAPTFLDLYVRGTAQLEAAGLGRGPARAVAHVGTELVLDGLLLEDPSPEHRGAVGHDPEARRLRRRVGPDRAECGALQTDPSPWDPALAAAYLAAVDELARVRLQFRGDGAPRFARFQERLAGHGLPLDYREPERVALRLEQILAPRPRLALDAEHRPRVTTFLEQARAELRERLPTLWGELQTSLGVGPASAPSHDQPEGPQDPSTEHRSTVGHGPEARRLRRRVGPDRAECGVLPTDPSRSVDTVRQSRAILRRT